MKRILFLIGFMLLTFSSFSANAECKGSSKSACSASKNCTWVKGYTAKSGKKVQAYCRNASGKGKAVSTEKKKQAAVKKAEKKPTKKVKKTEDTKKPKKKTKDSKKPSSKDKTNKKVKQKTKKEKK